MQRNRNNEYRIIVVPSAKVKVKPKKNEWTHTKVVATPLKQKLPGTGSGAKLWKETSRDSTPDELDLVEVEKQKTK